MDGIAIIAVHSPRSLVSPKAGMDEASTVNVDEEVTLMNDTPRGIKQCRVHSKADAIFLFAEKHSRLEPVVCGIS